MRNLKPKFSHIYVEKDAIGYPLTDIALSKFHRSTVLEIDHYKDIFNRPGQDFQIQKSSMKLILAKKKEPYIYPASEMVQDYNTTNVYYLSLIKISEHTRPLYIYYADICLKKK